VEGLGFGAGLGLVLVLGDESEGEGIGGWAAISRPNVTGRITLDAGDGLGVADEGESDGT